VANERREMLGVGSPQAPGAISVDSVVGGLEQMVEANARCLGQLERMSVGHICLSGMLCARMSRSAYTWAGYSSTGVSRMIGIGRSVFST
jgi:hypothetical protein